MSVAAWFFAHARRIPSALAIPIALAFLTEYSFYLLLGFGKLRDYFRERFHRVQLAIAIGISALLPYVIYTLPTGGFRIVQALVWTAILAAVAGWFVNPIESSFLGALRDLAFLVFLAVIILSGLLRWIFPAPFPKLPLEVLGHVTLIRSAILAVLLLRGGERTGIGFIPRTRDIGIGLLWFAACALAAVPLGLRLGQLHLSTHPPTLWPALGLLLGVFWVLALSEEFFFRGLLQQWLSKWTQSKAAGLIIGSILFASCHLGFRGAFPNWPVAGLSLVLGLCCGAAFWQAGSIRASMITHALAVGAWRLILSQ